MLAVGSADSQVVQELHLVTSHLLCEYVERALPVAPAAPVRTGVEVVLDGGAGQQVQA